MKYNKNQVKNIILNEGLIYAVEHFMYGDKISDRELRMYWRTAHYDIKEVKIIAKRKGYDGRLSFSNGKYYIDEIPVSEINDKEITIGVRATGMNLSAILKEVGLTEKEYGIKYAKGGTTTSIFTKLKHWLTSPL